MWGSVLGVEPGQNSLFPFSFHPLLKKEKERDCPIQSSNKRNIYIYIYIYIIYIYIDRYLTVQVVKMH